MSQLADQLAKLDEFLDAEGIEYFSADELTRHLNPKWVGPRNVVPPEEKWPNIILTALGMDEIRRRAKYAIWCMCAFRCLAYNRLVKSSDDSEHLEFKATDFRPLRWKGEFGTPAFITQFNELRAITSDVFDELGKTMPTGVGTYPSFLHADTHSLKGWRRRWRE